jgi:glutamate-1-semialdehyde 2,1-aminomutase
MPLYDFYSYVNKTNLSKAWYERACKVFPGGISHNIRFFPPYPFFVERASGKNLKDVDGNTFVDFWMGHWALILGHSHQNVIQPLEKELGQGTIFGTVNDTSVLLGELIQKFAPSAELMRFCSTGSEATMYATRIARAFTGKRIVAKVLGGWHGFNSDLMHSVNYPFEINEGLGLTGGEENFVQSIPFNDLASSTAILDTIKDDLACVILEPILGGAGGVVGERDYLVGLREYANKNNVLLIMDEIVTGFRLNFGTLSASYDIQPDLLTLGKIVGGGFPIGVVSGKEEIMKITDTSLKEKPDRCYVGGGTFSSNPISMKAGLLTMDYLRRNNETIYTKINRLGKEARSRLKQLFIDSGIDVEVTGLGSLINVHFLNQEVKIIRNAIDAAMTDQEKLLKYHFCLLADYGIFFLPKKMGAISFAHDTEDLDLLLSATNDIINRGILSNV